MSDEQRPVGVNQTGKDQTGEDTSWLETHTSALSFESSPFEKAIYANHVAANITSVDIELAFGKIIASASGGPPKIRPVAVVTLTPEVAFVALVTLQQALDSFRQRFGPIRELQTNPVSGRDLKAESPPPP
jgi:hypothetical protein